VNRCGTVEVLVGDADPVGARLDVATRRLIQFEERSHPRRSTRRNAAKPALNGTTIPARKG